MEKLVYIGKIISLEPIQNADFIESATVVCGAGGKWRGIVTKTAYQLGDKCIVYLADSLIPENEEQKFMAASNWRVKMKRFRGEPSEVLIWPYINGSEEVGFDITSWTGVTKYHKPVPPNLQGKMTGGFPVFIPKTDEPNYQNEEGGRYLQELQGKPYYITEKCDGSSTTAFRYKEKFGVCSRNWELEKDENNGYWQMAIKYQLECNLPEGYALQWETCGPGIQSNPQGLIEISAFAFSAYKINEHRYLTHDEFYHFCKQLKFPAAKLLKWGVDFDINEYQPFERVAEGKYSNGQQREGVVIRSQENLRGSVPLSFKVINLSYEK